MKHGSLTGVLRLPIGSVVASLLLAAGVACSDDGTGGGVAGSGGMPASGAAGTNAGASGTPAFGGSPSAGASFGGTMAGGASGSGGTTAGGAGTSGGGAGTSGSGAGTSGSGGTNGGAGAGGTAGAGRGGGTNGGAGTGGTSGFNPCPATGPCKILPLGDSITDGIGSPAPGGGYRVELFSKARADNKNITFVGGSANGPTMVAGAPFPRNHEGHSGWTIDQINGIVPSPALESTPHIVLLHIGTNDMVRSANGASDRLEDLVGEIVARLPDSLLVVAKIIPLSGGSGALTTFNAAIPGIVKTQADAGKHVIMVDQFANFPNSELGDGVHPNQAGYARMAGVWYEAIRTYLR